MTQQRPLGPQDIRAQRKVRVLTAQGYGELAVGVPIAYADQPTIVIRQDDGTHRSVVASLPWEYVDEDWKPGDVIRDDNGSLYWRSWDNADWVFMLSVPGGWKHTDVTSGPPIEPLTLLLRDVGDSYARHEPVRHTQ